jgi:hypothetical protein
VLVISAGAAAIWSSAIETEVRNASVSPFTDRRQRSHDAAIGQREERIDFSPLATV